MFLVDVLVGEVHPEGPDGENEPLRASVVAREGSCERADTCGGVLEFRDPLVRFHPADATCVLQRSSVCCDPDGHTRHRRCTVPVWTTLPSRGGAAD